jgi:hypothetical protein
LIIQSRKESKENLKEYFNRRGTSRRFFVCVSESLLIVDSKDILFAATA